ENQILRSGAIKDFQKMVYCVSEEEFDDLWAENEWYGKKNRWSMAWWKDHPHYKIKTNNYVKSWHCQLKAHYLGLMRKQRIDVLVHVLTQQIEPDFWHADLMVQLNFEKPRLSKVERASNSKAMEVPSTELDDMVDISVELTDKTPDIYIRSFSDSWTWYWVSVTDFKDTTGASRTAITRCECPEFESHESKCKHMFLASRYSGFAVHHFGGVETCPPLLLSPTQNQALPETVHDEKAAQIARIQGEIQTLVDLGEKLSTSADCGSRDGYIDLETQLASARHCLSDIIYARTMYTRQ
ncbi:hypothetical protein V5O48_018910, partial [Marasmius crinis-equi]